MKYKVWIEERKSEKKEEEKKNVVETSEIDGADNNSGNDNGGDSVAGESIHLSEYEVTGLTISGFSNGGDTPADINSIGSRAISSQLKQRNLNYTVKTAPRYEVDVTCKIRSNVDENTYISALTTFGQSVGILPQDMIGTRTDAEGNATKKRNYSSIRSRDIVNLFKWHDAIEGIAFTSTLLNSTKNLLKEFKMSAQKSAENCVNIKNWFSKYKEAEVKAEAAAPEEKGSKKDDKKVEAKNPISEKVYKFVKIEVVLSDIQSFYYEFNDMYIDSFTETFTENDGTCTYTFKLCQHYTENKNPNSYTVEKASFGDKVSNGFKKLIEIVLGGGKIPLSSGTSTQATTKE